MSISLFLKGKIAPKAPKADRFEYVFDFVLKIPNSCPFLLRSFALEHKQKRYSLLF